MTGNCRLSHLLKIIQEIGARDIAAKGFGKAEIFDKGMRWVISRIATKVNRIPAYDEEIEIVTFPEPPKWFFLPRYTTVLDKDGNVLLECETIWAVIDFKTRKPLLPNQFGLNIEYKDECEKTFELDSKIVPLETTNTLERKILFTDCDINQHMNNTVYVEWACDLLGSEFLKSKKLVDWRMAYHTEAKEGETLTMNYALKDDILYVIGQVGERKVYEVWLKFE
ncbi:MAG: hypothetical protein K6F36_04000 [Bacilli bacterium]|nr:hypothetical protein [Bacilli bacterium]